MKAYLVCAVVLLMTPATSAAGAFNRAVKQSEPCGAAPQQPEFNDQSYENFNQSLANLANWQEKSKIYFECLMNEANQFNSGTSNKANRQLADYRQTVEALLVKVELAGRKLDKKKL